MSWDSDIPDWVRSSSDILAYTWARSQPPAPEPADAQQYIPQDRYDGSNAWDRLNQTTTSAIASVTPGYAPTSSASMRLATPPGAYRPSPSSGDPPFFSAPLSYAASTPGWFPSAYAWSCPDQIIGSGMTSATPGYVPMPSVSTPLARPPNAYSPSPSRSGGHSSTPSFSSASPSYAPSTPGWSFGAHSHADAQAAVRRNSISSISASLPRTPARHPPVSATVPISAILPEVRQRLVSQPLFSIVHILSSTTASWPPERKGRLVAALTENWSTQHASLIVMALVPIGVPLSRPTASTSTPFAQIMSSQPYGPAGDFFDGFARATPPTRLQQVLVCIPEATPLPIPPPSSGSDLSSSLHTQPAPALGKIPLGPERRSRMRQLSELAHSQVVSG